VNLPSFSYYGPGSDYNGRAVCFTIGGLTVYFSYRNVVAFSTLSGTTEVCQNYWGPTTGKHLNAIDGGSKEARKARLIRGVFEERLESELAKLGFNQ
jgi:hypothetical protein